MEGRGWERSEDYDAVLNNIGTPKETIDSMSYEFKEYICNTIGKDEKFEFQNPTYFFPGLGRRNYFLAENHFG